jgi:hypothetical protein
VVLKFAEGTRVRLLDGALKSLDGRESELDQVVGTLGSGVSIERLFSRDVEDLDRERDTFSRKRSASQTALADLNNYYLVKTGGVGETTRLVNELNTFPLVEVAYADPIPVLFDDPCYLEAADIGCPTPNLEACQLYLGPAPDGYNYRAIESVVGARFPNGKMAHLENSWTICHEDTSLYPLINGTYLGLPPTSELGEQGYRIHGTACVGIMAARLNEFGITGMGSAVPEFYLCSRSNGEANMISLATGVLDEGDVMSSSFGYKICTDPCGD